MSDKNGNQKAETPKPEKDPETGRFLPGNSGNGGRRKGARAKLGEAFVADLLDDWEANGAEAIVKVRNEKPDAYLKVIASILPKEVNLSLQPFEEMTDEQLRQRAKQLLEELGPVAAFAGGGNAERSEPEAARKPSGIIPPVH